LLDEIINECDSLIEVLVSRFDYSYREELIQECRLLIISKLDRYNSERGTLHAWLTSVITNHCINYVSSSSRMLNIDDINVEVSGTDDDYKFDYDIGILVTRNRKRFPSLPSTMVDEVTRYICLSTMHSVYGKSRGVIKNIITRYKLSRNVATVLYHSTLLYMRQLHFDECDMSKVKPVEEMSLLKDLETELGTDTYKKLSVLFSGMYVKFP